MKITINDRDFAKRHGFWFASSLVEFGKLKIYLLINQIIDEEDIFVIKINKANDYQSILEHMYRSQKNKLTYATVESRKDQYVVIQGITGTELLKIFKLLGWRIDKGEDRQGT